MAIVRYFVLDISIVSQCRLLWYLPSSISVCLSASLMQFVILSPFTPIASNEVFSNMLRSLDPTVRWCVGILEHDMSSVIALAYMMYTAIDCGFVWRVRELLCSRLSSTFVDFLVSLGNWLILPVYEFSVCEFRQWCQCSFVDRDSIPDSVFIDLDCFWL